LLKKLAMERMGKIVAAIARESEKQKTQAPRDLDRQVEILRAALSASTPSNSSSDKP
jgi:hypothetical protein